MNITIISSEKDIKLATHGAKIVSLNPIIDVRLEKLDMEFSGLDYYDIDYGRIHGDAWNLINAWMSAKITDKKLTDLLTYAKISMIKAQKYILFQAMITLIRQYRILDAVIRKDKPKKITLIHRHKVSLVEYDTDFTAPLLIQICKNKKIKLKIIYSRGDRVLKAHQQIADIGIKALLHTRNMQRKSYYQIKKKNTAKLLFFHLGDDCMRISDPIARGLQDDYTSSIYICGDGVRKNSARSHASKTGIDYSYLEPFMNSQLCCKAKQFDFHNKKIWKKLGKSSMFRKLFDYDGFDLYPAFQPVLMRTLIRDFYENIKKILAMDAAVKKLKPKAGFVMNDVLFWGYVAATTLKHNGIPSVHIAHGPNTDRFSHSTLHTDHIFVWSELEKKKVESFGIGSDRIFVVGTDIYRNLLEKYGNVSRSVVCKELGIAKNQKILVFAARIPITKDFGKIRHLVSNFENDKDIQLIIKTHPADISATPKKLASMFETTKTIFINNYNFYKLLAAADMLISHDACRTSLDSIIFARPFILCVLPPKQNDDTDYKIEYDEKMIDIIRVDRIQALNRDYVQKILADNTRLSKFKSQSRKYFQKYYSELDMEFIRKFIVEQRCR